MADRVYLVSLCSVRAFLTAVGTRLILTFWGQSCLWLMGWWWRKSRWRIKAGLIASALLTHAPSAERGSLRLSPPQRKPVLSSAAIVWIWLMCPPLTFFLFQIQPLFPNRRLSQRGRVICCDIMSTRAIQYKSYARSCNITRYIFVTLLLL